jgi:hypothetical protein
MLWAHMHLRTAARNASTAVLSSPVPLQFACPAHFRHTALLPCAMSPSNTRITMCRETHPCFWRMARRAGMLPEEYRLGFLRHHRSCGVCRAYLQLQLLIVTVTPPPPPTLPHCQQPCAEWVLLRRKFSGDLRSIWATDSLGPTYGAMQQMTPHPHQYVTTTHSH